MKLQFKHQKFQADAAKAVVDVFAGQPYLTPTYMMDRGYGQQTITDDTDFTGWRNERIVPEPPVWAAARAPAQHPSLPIWRMRRAS